MARYRPLIARYPEAFAHHAATLLPDLGGAR